MGALRKVVPVSQILYGTDYWYRSAAETARGLTTDNTLVVARWPELLLK
ncbi:MAG: hypothetical protein JO323_09070 [Acidobacteriia bacterium]|nr:hypothetical protein [Terriglobia bacterium]